MIVSSLSYNFILPDWTQMIFNAIVVHHPRVCYDLGTKVLPQKPPCKHCQNLCASHNYNNLLSKSPLYLCRGTLLFCKAISREYKTCYIHFITFIIICIHAVLGELIWTVCQSVDDCESGGESDDEIEANMDDYDDIDDDSEFTQGNASADQGERWVAIAVKPRHLCITNFMNYIPIFLKLLKELPWYQVTSRYWKVSFVTSWHPVLIERRGVFRKSLVRLLSHPKWIWLQNGRICWCAYISKFVSMISTSKSIV